MGYHLTDHTDVFETASQITWPYTRDSLRRFLLSHPADAIVSFHPVPNYSLLMAMRQMGLRIPMMTVVVDLVSVHASWFAPGACSYFVPVEKARQRALHWGVPPERLEVMGGMPVRRAFVDARDMPRSEARKQLNLRDDLPVVLIVGGGNGMGPVKAVVQAIGMAKPQAQLVVITGSNRALYEKLHELDLPARLRIERYVPNMEVWMRAADILVTKAGPNTLCEAFVAGLPVVMYSALMGQEEGNVEYAVEKGAGIWAPKPCKAAAAVIELLADPDRRRAMAQRARQATDPYAAESLAHRLWELGHAEHTIVPARRPRSAALHSLARMWR
jgi:1,2-diacylglycerol 3-beta-galactosyltransferase